MMHLVVVEAAVDGDEYGEEQDQGGDSDYQRRTARS